jgi:integrase/recombinase XerC
MAEEGVLSQPVAAFLAHLTARHYSPNTVATYAFDLRHLLERVGERPPAELTSHDIRRALAGLHGVGLKAKTLARTLSAWRSFFQDRKSTRLNSSHNPASRMPSSA